MEPVKFWDEIFSREHAYSRVKKPDPNSKLLISSSNYFKDVKGKTLIDLGCGNGSASLFFASHGAHVLSIDYSYNAIKNLSEFCKNNSIDNIQPIQSEALQINTLGKVDFVFGSNILHHIEPFNDFVKTLNDIIKPDGKMFFHENNANSKILMFVRSHLAGKLWVPKFSDEEEHPLTKEEIKLFDKYFKVVVFYPELVYFRKIPHYIFGGHFIKPFKLFDDFLYRFERIKKLSYRQYLFISRK